MASSTSASERTSSDTRQSPAPSAKSTETTTSVPPAATDKSADDSSKLKTFLSILRKFVGVSDLSAIRFSLPANLLEPTPNLEYWNYLDRPEMFISIGDSDDEIGRMLAILRFWFTKDLKYVKGKPCKPYNSVLSEFFRCNWVVEDNQGPLGGHAERKPGPSAAEAAQPESGKQVKVSYLTEQTSHHPPVSAFWAECPEKGIVARGYDQLTGKFTGTSVRVGPGNHNLGIFLTLQHRDNEEYQMTHPFAHLGGFLRGSLYVTVADVCYITCPKTRLKAMLHYLDESWLGKTQNKMIGVVYRYDPENDRIMRLKDIPEKDVVARVEGCWREKIYYGLGNEEPKTLLIDLSPLFPVPKVIPPEAAQLPNESRRFWRDVTAAITARDFGRATKLKQAIEQRQREKAEQRRVTNAEWRPRFFAGAVTPIGRPDLTEEGRQALEGLEREDYRLEENKELGA